MILGFLVLVCTAVGCMAALFAGLLMRRRWILAVVAGVAASLATEYALGLTDSWHDPFFWEGRLRLIALSVIPIAIVAWLSARIGRKLLQENS